MTTDSSSAAPTGRVSTTSRVFNVWRPVRKILSTIVVFAGAIAFTSHLDTPWRRASPAPVVVFEPAVVRALTAEEAADQMARLLDEHTGDPIMARRIASAVISESRRELIDPALVVGVLLTENTTLNPHARSRVGARGLMQVMPLHRGRWGCGSSNLYDVEANICHGVQIFADLLKRTSSTETALLRYNGCRRGTNTPDCARYPGIVLRRAQQASDRLVAFATPTFLARSLQ